MELELRPDSDHAEVLQLARTQAHKRIDKDPDLVLKGIHPTSPGNYNPGRERAIAKRALLSDEEFRQIVEELAGALKH